MHKFVVSILDKHKMKVIGTSDAETLNEAIAEKLNGIILEQTTLDEAEVNILEISDNGFQRFYFKKAG